MSQRYSHIDLMWNDVVRDLTVAPTNGSRDGEMREIIGWSGTLLDTNSNWLMNKRRALSPAYGAAEFLWYMTRSADASMLLPYAPQYEKFTEDGRIAWGAYGNRVYNEGIDQLYRVLEILRDQPDSRQAVVTLWNRDDLCHALRQDRKDLPCTLTWQFIRRKNVLHMITSMRSNDVWLGMPYDVFCFTNIQRALAASLDCKPGEYTHQVGSMHLYQRNHEAAMHAVSCRDAMGAWVDAPTHKWSGGDSLLDVESAAKIGEQISQVMANKPRNEHPPTILIESFSASLLGDMSLDLLQCMGAVDPKGVQSPALKKGLLIYANR